MNRTDDFAQNPAGHLPSDDAFAGRTPAVEPGAEVSELSRHADPSRAVKAEAATRIPGRGVEWVRPSDLMARAGSHVAGRGIDFHAELARRARGLGVQKVTTSRRAISERARRLPPASAFGRGSGSGRFSRVARSGIGLG